MIWRTARGVIDLGKRGVVMGIVNVTPDSFSDGGKFFDADSAIGHALRMFEEGAVMVDVGGESTRPGSLPVSPAEETRRVLPVVEGILARAPHCLVSVDTSKAMVAKAALEAGAAVINDVTALRGDSLMAGTVAQTGAGLVLMHMRGSPLTMQSDPVYGNVVAEVRAFLEASRQAALAAGIGNESIALDPGIGFGKDVRHNVALLRDLGELSPGGCPVVVGVSRKSFLSKITPAATVADRLWPTVALTALLRDRGAQIFRVHDVRENVLALKTAEAVLGSG